MKESYKKTSIDTIINATADFALIPLTFIRLPILTKNLSTVDYGVWSLVFTTIALITPFTTLGLGVSMSRFLPSEKNSRNLQNSFFSVLIFRLSIVLGICGIVFMNKASISNILFEGYDELLLITLVLLVFNTIESLYLRLLTIIRNIRLRSIIKIINGYIPTFIIALLLINNFKLIEVLYSIIAFKLFLVIYLFVNQLIDTGISRPDFSMIKDYLSYGLPTMPSSMGFWIVNLSDRYIIAMLIGASQVGIYSAAYQIGSIPYTISSLINFVIMVATARLYDDGKIDEVKAHLSYSLKYFLMISIPFFFGSLIISHEILLQFSTKEIANGGKLVIPIVALANLFFGVYNLWRYVLLLTKQTKYLVYIWAISAPINIIFNFLLIPRIGIIGAAISTIFCYFISMIAVGYIALKTLTFRFQIKFIIKSIIASLGMLTYVFFSKPIDGILETLIIIFFGVIIYFLLLFLQKSFNENEIALLKSFIKKKI